MVQYAENRQFLKYDFKYVFSYLQLKRCHSNETYISRNFLHYQGMKTEKSHLLCIFGDYSLHGG